MLSRPEGGAEPSYKRVVNASVCENQTVNFLDYVDIDESLLDGSVEDPCFRTTVHNIDVEDFHTFHVGRAGVLVRGAECK